MAHRIFVIDDELNIQKALSRLLQKENYEVQAFASAEEALSKLEEAPVSLVICDLKMPGMSGVEFFQIVKKRWPDTMRFIISGYSDFEGALDAVNKGDIFRFITKPWANEELLENIRDALSILDIRNLNDQLIEKVGKQNDELLQLNETLEGKVAERTAELVVALHKSDMLNAALHLQNTSIIRAFAGLIDLRYPIMGEHCRRVARLVKPLCQKLEINSVSESQQIMIAGLLHDIGKIGLPDVTLAKTAKQLIGAERREVMNHPVIGQGQIQVISELSGVGILIRYHHENYDGSGYPEGLAGQAIPLGARIIRVLDGFDHRIRKLGGIEGGGAKTVIEAMLPWMGKKYDYDVVHALMSVLELLPEEFRGKKEEKVPFYALLPGMTLSRDLRTKKGHLILPTEETLGQGHIDKIMNYSKLYAIDKDVYVYAAGE